MIKIRIFFTFSVIFLLTGCQADFKNKAKPLDAVNTQKNVYHLNRDSVQIQELMKNEHTHVRVVVPIANPKAFKEEMRLIAQAVEEKVLGKQPSSEKLTARNEEASPEAPGLSKDEEAVVSEEHAKNMETSKNLCPTEQES